MLRRKRKPAHRNSKINAGRKNCKPVSGNPENLEDKCCIIEVRKKDCLSPWRSTVKKVRKIGVDVEGNEAAIISGNSENLQGDNYCYEINDHQTDLGTPCKQAKKDVRKVSVSVKSDEPDFISRSSCVVTDDDDCYVVYDSELSRTNVNLRCNISSKSCICSSEEANDKFIASIIPQAYSDPQARQILGVHEGNDIECCLDTEEVTLDFQPSVLHQLHSSLKWISPSRKRELTAQNIPIRTGKWSKQEDMILLRNWNSIVEKYQIDNPVLLLGMYRGVNSVLTKFIHAKKLLFYLGKDLNDRPLHSIYHRARSMLDMWNYKGRFSEEDKEKLLKLFSRLGNQWSKIAVLMNRPALLCLCTTRLLLSCKRRGAWTAEEDRLLIKSVKKHVGREKWMTKYRRYPWNKIAQDVCGRNVTQCRQHWLTCLCWKPKLFAQPKWKKVDSALLVYFMYMHMVEEECFIDWDMLYEKFKTSVSSYVALQSKWCRLKYKVPDFTSKDHESVVIYLYKNLLPKFLKSCKISTSDLDRMKNSKL